MKKKKKASVGFHKGSGLFTWRIDGQPGYFPKTVSTQEQAENELAKLLQQMDESIKPDDKPISILFAKYMEATKAKYAPKNFKDKKRILDAFTLSVQDKPLSSILPVDVQMFLNAQPVRTTGGGKAVAYRHLAAAFNYMAGSMGCTKKPHLAAKMRPKEAKRPADCLLNREEFEAVRLTIDNIAYADLAEFLFEAGCRPSEALRTPIKWYSHNWGRITIPADHTKTKSRPRIIMLNDKAKEIVERNIAARKAGPIFPFAIGEESAKAHLVWLLKRGAKRIGRDSGPICGYSLRHSFAVLQQQHYPAEVVAELMGDTLEVFLRHYAHIDSIVIKEDIRPK